VPGRPGSFRTSGLAKPNDVTLSPFHTVHFQRYAIYWQLTDAARAAELQREVAEAERQEQELEANTIDRVRLGEQQPETDHQLLFEKSRTGYGPLGKHFRAADDGGWFSFSLKPRPVAPRPRCAWSIGAATTARSLICWSMARSSPVLQSKEVKLVGGKLEIPPASACTLVLPAK
jgi:hypothetical protein